ncbi:hypothetical protein PP505_gp33 [Gordonia phage Dorito]|uniref:Uncharacterized protein n=1 Tax=Gordonia phage Dorito TaxID=2499023 RepID=A0A3S9UAK4_9CAUD|nr:hypothetical protein PP505_gp33 [Gordonia phage Dorito]AZS07303.1 hypothetical protein PBI_DORITO_33 [Gordonia phage Dorito]UTN93551.1 hypothetical protein SEA_OREGANO_38 [Gordonia phage Oregano]
MPPRCVHPPEFKPGDRVRIAGTGLYGKVGAVGHHRGVSAFVVDLLGPRRGDVHLSLATDLEHLD